MGRGDPVFKSVAELGVGDVIAGRYRIERFIARGGMGEVFEAISTSNPSLSVAIKLLLADYGDNAEWRARFKREIAIAAELRSPHIPRLFEAGKTQTGRRWIAFEYIEGESLDARLVRDRVIEIADLAPLIDQSLRALEAAHELGIVHRDVKPSNLFLANPGPHLYVLDFGIAKRIRPSAASSGLTSLDERLGTPSYMSPEQLANPASVGTRSDLFSLGAVAFRALTGRLPFATTPTIFGGDAPTVADATGFAWPEEVEAWFRRMIAVRSGERFTSAAAARSAWRGAVTAARKQPPRKIEDAYRHEDTDVAALPDPFSEEAPRERKKGG